jgi:hypothetical protein
LKIQVPVKRFGGAGPGPPGGEGRSEPVLYWPGSGEAMRSSVDLAEVRSMALESDKIMFEVYRETSYNRRYRVVYFTELTDRNKESEINRAMAGEHYFDGFIAGYKKEEAKAVIQEVVDRLNNGEAVAPQELEARLASYLPEQK